MFFVKNEIGEGVTLSTEISDTNTYTTCIDCGHEIQVDLDEAIIDGHLDLFGTGMRCEGCSYRHALQHRDQEWAKMLIADYEARGA